MTRPDTETLDRLYLELSQFTTARTGRELVYADALYEINKICNSTKHLNQIADIANVCGNVRVRLINLKTHE